MPLEPGEHVGRYDIVKLLGRGGETLRPECFTLPLHAQPHHRAGEVYMAQDPLLERRVALKVLPDDCRGEPQCIARFERQAKVMAHLLHPNIVEIKDLGYRTDGTPYIAMAPVTGGTLSALLRSTGPLDAGRAVTILRDLAGALDHVHSAGIVHRNVTPANILHDESGRAYLADFCLARSTQTGLTRTGVFLGTPPYMAPEQVKGAPADFRCDIFALGVVAYEMLTGRGPFRSDNVMAVFYKITHEEPPSPRQWNEALPPECDAVFAHVLAKDPANRYASASAFVSALEAALGESSSA